MSRTLIIASIAALALGAFAQSDHAVAGGDWYDEDDAYYSRDYYSRDYYGRDYYPPVQRYVVVPARPVVVVPAPAPPIVVRPYAAPVFGWVVTRPQSCGRYRYWDGDGCRDARWHAPYVGPRW